MWAEDRVLALKVLLSSALIAYVATRVDLGLLLVQLKTIHLGQLALAARSFVQIVIGAVRCARSSCSWCQSPLLER
jgi:hypothetical protein